MDGFAGAAAATLSRGTPDAAPHRLRAPEEPDAGEQIAEIRLIPRFHVEYGGRPVALCTRAERVLAFLAIEEGVSRRSIVAGALWPESTSDRALASLRTALWSLSHAEITLVDITQNALSLRAQVHVDLTEATSLARHAVDGASDLPDIPHAVALLRRDLLIDWTEDWTVIPKEQFRQLRLQALESLADQLITHGRLAQAVVTALDIVGSEPLRESAHLLLMRAYLAQGNRSAAIAQYRSCARLLRDELGLAPSAGMARLLDTALTDPTLH